MKKRAKQTQPPGQSHMSVFRLDGNTNRAAHSSNSNNNQSTVNSSLPFRHVDPAVGIEGMNQGCQSKKSAEIDDGENTCSSCNNTSHTVSRCNGTVSDVDSPSSGEDGIRNFDPRGQRRTAVYDSNHILRKMNVRSTNGTGTHGSRPRRIREPIASRTRSQRKKNEANSVVL
ncbi:hypothetical protein BDF20DRAFT_882131, partial [Mycotypha africana]|uniref:uncharacterized protein n=1 Tax=Mycotypha africana TaxID=64632 RepID=UPI0023017CC8